ncbi:MAG: biotin--[acetyl-CoA-carboxylase] ligase [Dehalococcoidia bacterium]|nr:biotin--[acetyl-CoA-carboxylase] ligase [Dehalococcoidia bacterium]
MENLDLARLVPLRSGVVGARLRYVPRVTSTMDEARRLAEDGAHDGLVVVAEEQTLGRGRFGRGWVSNPGQDLTFSVVLCPTADQLRLVNMAATMAVQETAVAATGRHAAIKWPNDVVMSGKKLSGILVESVTSRSSSLDFAVVGVGLNVNLRPEDHFEIREIATSLAEQAGRALDRTEVLLQVLGRLDELYSAVRRGLDLVETWTSRLETIGREIDVSWQGRRVSGRACGVDAQGNLLIQTDQGMTTVVAGEVTLSEPPA